MEYYTTKKEIVIPKGTKFTRCLTAKYADVLTASIGDGLKDSTIDIIISDDTIEELESK